MDKYKEALNKAKKLMATSAAFDRFTIEHIFPELKESEDERIRKGLIKAFGSIGKKEWGGVNVKNAIAWLEKQGKQKPAMIQWKGYNLKEVVDFTGVYKEGFEKWFHNSWEEYEKYVHEHNNIFKIFNKDGSHIEVPVGAWIVKTPDGYNTASRYVFRQKPAWSEEDEVMLDEIISDLKLLRDKDSGESGKAAYQSEIEWLKSIKNRYTWKPSYKQIKHLTDVVDDAKYRNNISINGYTPYLYLSTLLQQLKKLI